MWKNRKPSQDSDAENHSRSTFFAPRWALIALGLIAGGAFAQNAAPPGFMRSRDEPLEPSVRAEAVESARQQSETLLTEAREQANRLGLARRIEAPDGSVQELIAWNSEGPLYFTTLNANAAISTASDRILGTPYFADGAGTTIGVWDQGPIRSTHVEFGGRVTVKDEGTLSNHATHVGGTIGASGANASARGMAPAVRIDSYDWYDDYSEMMSRGASAPNEEGKLAISNHSYGFAIGWSPGNPMVWHGSGSDANAVDPRFGQYNSVEGIYGARDADNLAHQLPYYLMFWAAGNDRTQNPSTGSNVRLSPEGTIVSYDPALHPPGDGVYRSGYDTISMRAVAKNVVTVGAVNDAETSGQRDVSKATVADFSSWGPTDDGRIKPDVVANGVSLYSTFSSGDTAYGSLSGTSMASPNAAGTAQQLVAYFGTWFPEGAMRASSLKGLLIHTADFLGPDPGPNYRTGWGLINAEAAADLIRSVATNPTAPRMIEEQITPASPTHVYRFDWDGSSPIRATLCWTDPPGSATTQHDNRTRRLVNDLNLHVVDPAGGIHLPWVMPFVTSNFNLNQLSAPATTGTNRTDNVAQVDLLHPSIVGTYEAVVTYSGTLANNQQVYSLLISGNVALPPEVHSVSPTSIPRAAGTGILLKGDHFAQGATASLVREGHPEVPIQIQSISDAEIHGTLDSSGIATGFWDARVVNPDLKEGVLTEALAVVWTLFEQTLDSGTPGWSTYLTAGSGSSGWTLTDTASHTPEHSYGIVPPAAKRTDNLESEGVPIPATARGLELGFWHRFNLESFDGGKLQLQADASAFQEAGQIGSGSTFVQGGYNAVVGARTGNPNNHSEFASTHAWTGAEQSDFGEVVLALDHGIYAGKTLRARWRLATDTQNDSGTWHWNVDTLRISGFHAENQPPFLVVPAAAEPSTVTGWTSTLSVTADDDGGAYALTYTWSVAEGPAGTVQFSINGSNAARETQATFSAPGEYVLQVHVEDAGQLSVSDSVAVTVRAPATLILVH